MECQIYKPRIVVNRLIVYIYKSCKNNIQENTTVILIFNFFQENDIFLGWEKGAYKKWGKSKKKCSDLTLEEMKKQAAVQCLRSASDEVRTNNIVSYD